KAARFLLFNMFVRGGFPTFLFFQNLFVEISHSLFLSANVKGPIPTDGEEPFGRGAIGLPALGAPQFNKGLLDHVSGSFRITEYARGVLQERSFETTKEIRQVLVVSWGCLGHAHKLFTSLNARAANLLEKITRPFYSR